MKLWPIFVSSFLMVTQSVFGTLEHKDEYMDTYLTSISLYMNEKTELLEHIKKNPNGTYIDIGTGGDAVAVMVKELPKTAHTHLIAADIDPLVLNSIKTRRPEIVEFLGSKTGPKVELVAMCATNMNPIKDSSVSGIGASALMHEVFSYVPAKSSIDQFVNELCRVLEKDGVFIYRDPKWVNDPFVPCIMIIKNDIGKYYATLFLAKFLDRQLSCQRDYKNDCCKPSIYKTSDIKFNVFLKDMNEPKQFSYEEFMLTPTATIDYSKNFSVEAPKGLIAEIQRHYLMFLRNDFIPGFINPQLFSSDLNLLDLSKDERIMMKDFCLRKSIQIIDNVIKKEQFSTVFVEYSKLYNLFRKPLQINLHENSELGSLIQKYIEENKISRNLLYLLNPETAVIDVKLLALLF